MPDRLAIVVDASAIAAVVFNEPASDDMVEDIGDARLIAPSLLPYELANVYVIKVRRYPDQKTALDRAFSLLGALDIELVAVPADAAGALASETGLTAYDAAYLWLARRLGLKLVTLDQKLGAAAGEDYP
jgi:predicted nucleic acid-binding protein